jgi:hypothetical protein
MEQTAAQAEHLTHIYAHDGQHVLPEDAARPLRRGRVQSAALSSKLGLIQGAPAGDARRRRPAHRLPFYLTRSAAEVMLTPPRADPGQRYRRTPPMFDEAHQPRLADLVEKGLDVAIEHPVDAPPADPERERIQRLVLIALRSEPVAEPQELRLIDRRQDCHHRRLDDLVLQGSDAERPPDDGVLAPREKSNSEQAPLGA